jgi:hypothetical protein
MSEDGPKVRGNYVLTDGLSIIRSGRVEEPSCGCVANTGTFALASLVDHSGLTSRLRVFSPDGTALLSRKFSALPESVGISSDGCYVAYQVANSNVEAASGKLSFFDLTSTTLAWKRKPPHGWAEEYQFDVGARVLHVKTNLGSSIGYGFDGTLQDAQEWRDINTNPEDRLARANRQLRKAAPDDSAARVEAIEYLKKGLLSCHSDYAAARLHRRIGELYLEMGDKLSAISEFERALRGNPNIGVASVYNRLRKASEQGPSAPDGAGSPNA